MNINTQHHIIQLLSLYAQVQYPLNTYQIRMMLPVPIQHKMLQHQLDHMVHNALIVSDRHGWYTLPEQSACFAIRNERAVYAGQKKIILSRFLRLVGWMGWVRLIMLTGSMALENAREDDDIDIMIVTSPHTMFITRLCIVCLLKLSGLARKRNRASQPNTICTNLWMDQSDLAIIARKQTLYSARELVNAQALVDRDGAYAQMLIANRWVSRFLPNWNIPLPDRAQDTQSAPWWVRTVNACVGYLQIWYMRGHMTHENVSHTQLWFHPILRDYTHE